MAYNYSLHGHSATARPILAALPAPLVDQILTHIPDPTPLLNTSTHLRALTLAHLATRSQQHLSHARTLQSLNSAANLPNELLHQIFSYLPPLSFYTATLVCTSWRNAASYYKLIDQNITLSRQRGIQVPLTKNTDFERLAFYLQCNGELKRLRISKCAVSAFYCRNPGGVEYPEIHLSDNGHYFLSCETVAPFRVHVYCTYRAVLPGDAGTELGYHEWDTTPVWLLTLPETGRVVSASFGPAIHGGMKEDRSGVYPKGVDVLVLFEGRVARLYKIRAVASGGVVRRAFGRAFSSGARGRWRIWGSIVFEEVCPLKQKPVKAKLGERSEKAIFAGVGELDVWEGIDGGKETVQRKWIHVLDTPGKAGGIYTGRIWDSEKGADVDYIVCASTHACTNGVESESEKLKLWKGLLSVGKTQPGTACTTIITSTHSLVYNYTNFVQLPSTGTPQFIGITPHTLSHLQLKTTLDIPDTANHHPFMLRKKADLGIPTSESPLTHLAAINIPSLSPSTPITVTATASGSIYILIPPCCPTIGPCSRPSCQCRSSSDGWRRVGRIPQETGGRITEIRISYRGPVWVSKRRMRLHWEDVTAVGRKGVVVVVVGTDKGRVEVCWLDLGEGEGENAGAGRTWDLEGRVVGRRGMEGKVESRGGRMVK